MKFNDVSVGKVVEINTISLGNKNNSTEFLKIQPRNKFNALNLLTFMPVTIDPNCEVNQLGSLALNKQ